jgi:hypothetical protein
MISVRYFAKLRKLRRDTRATSGSVEERPRTIAKFRLVISRLVRQPR